MTLQRIAPSLLSADFGRLAEEVADVEGAGADLLHLDIMDGHFVPNLTFGPPVVRALARTTRLPLDAHLMVTDADELITSLAEVPVARIAVHVEACSHLHRTLASIRECRIAAGIALNPATPLGTLDEVLPWVDFVLVMSVDPGFGGQRFIPESLDKIRRLRARVGSDLDIAVDGGIGPDNADALVSAGATTLVAGSSVFGAENRRAAIQGLRTPAQQRETR